MEISNPIQNDKKWMGIIAFLSVFVVVAVAFLIYKSQNINKIDTSLSWIYILPKVNAFLNGSVTIFLILGVYFIKQKNIKLHRTMMLSSFVFSTLFLVFYILYHYNAPETKFGDLNHDNIVSDAEKVTVGSIRYVYYILLLTHIVLAAIIIPLSLTTLYRSLSNQRIQSQLDASMVFAQEQSQEKDL
jgi:putative membrane protein